MTSTADLSTSRCTPLKGEAHRLPAATAARYLAELPGWALAEGGDAIVKTFRFADYYRTLAFVNALAWVAHAEDHHPDLSVHYDRVVVRYSTHDVGGLSQNDVICAAKANHLA
ncbi:MAG: 4a-hydroxytetrahydrobiopterin dehydratase [Arenimonas sp.]|nr:4a-hydroxytetrahydrobiopterin dehydratase [Arenimonas sp.]